eukprot:scaffold114294_cov19-Tisochrysis_lutea.AAC.3
MQVSNKITYRVPCQAWTWQANWTFRIPCWEIRSIVAHMAEQASQFQGAGVKLAPIMCTPCLASSIESCLESSINPRPLMVFLLMPVLKHACAVNAISF